MANLNFAIAIRLVEQGVQNTANKIKNSLLSIQMQAMALAGALAGGIGGLGDMLSRLVDVARETSRVQTALKNVSGGAGQFGKNLSFVKTLARQYGLEINGTTSAFTKFTAAASAAGMAMDDQQKVFSAVSRSITAFGLSGDEATLTFYAISQMMAKGKISAEELRRQLGERMPIAMEAMSRAAKGLGFKENLDDLLKGGKLNSLQILPKFAEELNNLVVSVDTDNAETSVNRLKNAFADLATEWDIAGKFKTVVDGIIKLLEYLKSNVATGIGAIGGIISARLFGALGSNLRGHYQRIREANLAELQKLKDDVAKWEESVRVSGAEVSRQESKHIDVVDKARAREAMEVARAEQGVQMALSRQQEAQNALSRLEADRARQVKERARVEQSLGRNNRSAYRQYVDSVPAGGRVLSEQAFYERNSRALERHRAENLRLEEQYTRRRLSLLARYNQAAQASADADIRRSQAVERARTNASNQIARSQSRLNTAINANNQAIAGLAGANNRMLNSTAVAATGFAGKIQLAGRAIRTMLLSVRASIVSMMSSFVPMAIIAGIGAIIGKLIDMRNSWNEVRNAQTAYKKEAEIAVNRTQEVQQLERLINTLRDAKATDELRNNAKRTLLNLLGLENMEEQKLLQLAVKRLEYEKMVAKAKFAQERGLKAESELDELNLERARKGYVDITPEYIEEHRTLAPIKHNQSLLNDFSDAIEDVFSTFGKREDRFRFNESIGKGYVWERQRNLDAKRGTGESTLDFRKDLNKALALKDIKSLAEKDEKEASSKANELLKELTKIGIAPKGNPIPTATNHTNVPVDVVDDDRKGKKRKKSEVEKIEEEYAESLRNLNGQLGNNLITQKEYDQELNALKEKTARSLAGELGADAEKNATYKQVKDFDVESEERKILTEYSETIAENNALLDNGVITLDQFNEAVRAATRELLDKLGRRPALSEDGKKAIEEGKKDIQVGGKYAGKVPQREVRDTTFDYKKDEIDILEEETRLQDEYVENLKKATAEGANLDKQLQDAIANSSSLEKSLKLATIRKDLGLVQKELKRTSWSTLTSSIGAIRSMHSGVKSLVEALKDVDASPLEKILSVIETMISLVDGINTIANSLSDLSIKNQELRKVEDASNKAGQEAMQSSITMMQEKQAVDAMTTSQEISNLASTTAAGAEASKSLVATATTNIAASQAEATANAAKGASVLPFPANLIAIAGAITAVISLFARIPKFANGGIVPGNSRSGDRVLAGVNSGELILNEAQQANIASKLVRGNQGVNVDVHISERVRGRDLRRSVKKATRYSDR